MTMASEDTKLQKLLEEHQRLAESRGFTLEYQNEQEKKENVISFPRLAPATSEKYDQAALQWALWRLSRKESGTKNFSKDEPDPSPQILKLFVEFYIATRKRNVPSQKTVCCFFTSFTSRWERETSRSLPMEVKKDVLNFIRNDLTSKYALPTEPRTRSLVTAKDIEYLLRRLFGDDTHDYVHERARVQTGSALALFAGSGSRAGAIVESSSYRNTNECLYYKVGAYNVCSKVQFSDSYAKHLSFHIKWSSQAGTVKRWVTIDPQFLKGWRYRDDATLPKTWFREHPILAMNFVFWVIVHGIADRAFKGISSVEELLAQRPPKGRESWTLQWAETAKELPFFRMVTPNGPKADKGLTFSSLRHNFTSLAQRDGFKDQLCVHGIRAELANRVDPKASEATRSQALDHQDHTTFLKYQAQLKALDMQALMYGMEPDYECRDMEQSMAHHRDPNVPLRLDAVTLHEFEHDEEILRLNTRIADLSRRIAGQPSIHKSLAEERARLYTQKAKKLRAKRSEYISQWWNNSYEGYISGKGFSERDTTNLFEIFAKYIPTRTRLRENLFKEVPLDSEVGRQCLQDMISLCTSTERVAYYPGLTPVDGQLLLGNCKIAQSIFYNAGGRH
ncbi:hypothetical protein LV165_006163 [Aspergillus fumigatus]|nr:hypothetical protein LV165_006163 [Aspergillus fumigatus]KAJ8158679.1 hypothetical protein LV162_005534 [Aspergillus fumigatus]KAJ8204280.1 hypothetical protein LV158_007252 [Aspergillus fumigatus]